MDKFVVLFFSLHQRMPLRNRPPRRSQHVAPVSQFFSPVNIGLLFSKKFSWITLSQLSALTILTYPEGRLVIQKPFLVASDFRVGVRFNRCLSRKRGTQELISRSLRSSPFGRNRWRLLWRKLSFQRGQRRIMDCKVELVRAKAGNSGDLDCLFICYWLTQKILASD